MDFLQRCRKSSGGIKLAKYNRQK